MRIRQVPSSAQRLVELDNHQPPVDLSLGESKLGRIESLLRLKDFVIVRQPLEVARPRKTDGFLGRLHTADHLLADGIVFLARDQGIAVLCATHDPAVIEQADVELRL